MTRLRRRAHRALLALAAGAPALAAVACLESSSTPPPAAPPPPCPPGAICAAPCPGPGCAPPPPPSCAPGAPCSQPPPTPGPAPAATQPPPGPAARDPIAELDLPWMRARAVALLAELVAALPADRSSRVAGIPLVIDDRPGEVNAYAACSTSGKAAMAISDGLLEVQAWLAQCRSTDELYGTRTTATYIELVAREQRPGQPLVRPGPGLFTQAQRTDPRRGARQARLYDEQVAFVLGHELAHHHLGHLPCTARGGLSPGELGGVLGNAVPILNQPNELAADVWGVDTVLAAGSRRADAQWTEGGALLNMEFFAGLDGSSPIDILFGFERTHPPPALRVPVIQQAAAAFRLTGGQFPLF